MTLQAFAAGLLTSPQIRIVATLSHADALTWRHQWANVNMVIVDAADERLRGDQFPGVGVVRQIRTHQGETRPEVVVVTGHFDNDGLRQCMAEVGADFFFLRSDLRTADALIDIVLHHDNYRRGVPAVADQATARALGITPRSQVAQLVSYVTEHGLDAALDPIAPQRTDPHSRRWYRHRQAMANLSRIEAINLTTGQPPQGNQRIPSLRQFGHLLTWASRTNKPNTPPRNGNT